MTMSKHRIASHRIALPATGDDDVDVATYLEDLKLAREALTHVGGRPHKAGCPSCFGRQGRSRSRLLSLRRVGRATVRKGDC